jgi:diadenylate cyclase
MEHLTAPLLEHYPKLTLLALIDILLAAFLIYQFLMMVRGRRAAHVLIGILTLVAIYVVAAAARLEMVRRMLAAMAPYTAFALIVMFQSELRRVLVRLGRREWMSWGSRLRRREFVEEMLLALDYLSQKKIGALIVLERDIGLRTFIESGVPLEAVVSRDLLLAIFHPNAALHDGAVIIQGERVAAAACFLPLSTNPTLMSIMGTRHRAAIGISEDTDCLALLVSEETGRLSVASFGEIHRHLTLDQVREHIEVHFGWKGARPERGPEALKGEPAEEAGADHA